MLMTTLRNHYDEAIQHMSDKLTRMDDTMMIKCNSNLLQDFQTSPFTADKTVEISFIWFASGTTVHVLRHIGALQ